MRTEPTPAEARQVRALNLVHSVIPSPVRLREMAACLDVLDQMAVYLSTYDPRLLGTVPGQPGRKMQRELERLADYVERFNAIVVGDADADAPTPAELRRLILEVVDGAGGRAVSVDAIDFAYRQTLRHSLHGNYTRRRVARNIRELVEQGKLRYVAEEYLDAAGRQSWRTVGVARP